jgi:hypothetical protein
MMRIKPIQMLAVAFSSVGLLMPQVALAQAPVGAPQNTARIIDAQLAEGGVLSGQVVDRAGVPRAGTAVFISQGTRSVVRTVTDAQGRFVVTRLAGGLYQIHTDQGGNVYRFWTAATAPPAAQHAVLVVEGAGAVRGQYGPIGNFFTNPVILGSLVLGAIAIPIIASNSNSGS